jgi:hypothetical protein
VEYVEPLCGHAKRYLLSLYTKESLHEGMPKSGIEVKVRSEDCLAKCVAVIRGNDTYF